MRLRAIKATVYAKGDIMTIIIPRKVTQGEVAEAIKSDKLTFGEKAKLVDYEILSVNIELSKDILEIPVSDAVFNAVKTDNAILYIM